MSLPHDITEGISTITQDDIRDHFQVFGDIEEVRIIKNKEENVMRGFGFVLFTDRVGYNRVFENGEIQMIKNKEVLCDLSRLSVEEFF